MKLGAVVKFYDVDGNSVIREYTDNFDLYNLLDSLSYNITDPDNFPKTRNKSLPGINGVVDISREISITINPLY